MTPTVQNPAGNPSNGHGKFRALLGRIMGSIQRLPGLASTLIPLGLVAYSAYYFHWVIYSPLWVKLTYWGMIIAFAIIMLWPQLANTRLGQKIASLKASHFNRGGAPQQQTDWFLKDWFGRLVALSSFLFGSFWIYQQLVIARTGWDLTAGLLALLGLSVVTASFSHWFMGYIALKSVADKGSEKIITRLVNGGAFLWVFVVVALLVFRGGLDGISILALIPAVHAYCRPDRAGRRSLLARVSCWVILPAILFVMASIPAAVDVSIGGRSITYDLLIAFFTMGLLAAFISFQGSSHRIWDLVTGGGALVGVALLFLSTPSNAFLLLFWGVLLWVLRTWAYPPQQTANP